MPIVDESSKGNGTDIRKMFRGLVVLIAAAQGTAAFPTEIHRKITVEVIRNLVASRQDFRYSEAATEEIDNANECIDMGPEMFAQNRNSPCLPNRVVASPLEVRSALNRAEDHFDDERIADGFLRLEALRAFIREETAAGNYALVRKMLGAALHAIQDFYPHTNWVELGYRDLFENDQGQSAFAQQASRQERALRLASPQDDVCVFQERVERDAATNEVLVTKVIDKAELRPEADRGGFLLTSGFFFESNSGVAKCNHGLLLAGAGISKDYPNRWNGFLRDENGRSFHEIAHDLAMRHTEQFVRRLLLDLAGNREALQGIFGRFAVSANRLNPLSYPILAGEEYEIRASGDQSITWGYEGTLSALLRIGKPITAPPQGVDADHYLRVSVVTPPIPNAQAKCGDGRHSCVGALIGVIKAPSDCGFGSCRFAYFYIGRGGMFQMPASGTLYLTVNDGNLDNNQGHFDVEIRLRGRKKAPSGL